MFRTFSIQSIVLFLALVWMGFSPAAAIVNAPKNPNLAEGRFAIGMREELGEHTAEIETILRANPKVRLGWPSAYEISADPDWPDDYYLLDMNNPAASSTHRYWNEVPSYNEPAHADPIFIGRLDDGTFAAGLESALKKIARRQSLIRLGRPIAYRTGAYLEIDCVPSTSCPGRSESTTMLIGKPLYLDIEVADLNPAPQYVYVLMIKPDHGLEWLFTSASDRPTPPGLKFGVDFTARPFVFDQGGRYDLVTITSATPLDPALLDSSSRDGIDRGRCRSVLERVVCQAISGEKDPTPSEEPGSLAAEWRIDYGGSYYGKNPPRQAVGGGTDAPRGYAPWAAQIYSHRPYTDAQRADDLRLLDSNSEKKFLDQLSTGQEEHRCGGALIAPDIVLTAAHCLQPEGAKFLADRKVHVGSQQLRGEPDGGGTDYDIVAVVYHQGYLPSKDKPTVSPPQNDLALLKIRPIRRAATARPIKLPNQVSGYAKAPPPSEIEVLGWGYTKARRPGQSGILSASAIIRKPDQRGQVGKADLLAYATNLQVGKLEVLKTDDCRPLVNYGAVTDKHICAETPPPAKATRGSKNTFSCRGDSGGPVIRHVGQWTVQVGVVSWAWGCGQTALGNRVQPGQRNPSVFVNLEKYTGWIDKAKGSFRQGAVIPVPE